MPDRVQLKREAREILRGARISPWLFALVFLLITDALGMLNTLTSGSLVARLQQFYPQVPVPDVLLRFASLPRMLVTFIAVFVPLLNMLLETGSALYHMGVRKGREMPLSTLFEGFSLAGRVIVLGLLQTVFVALWSMLFIVPGVVAAYSYRFALYNLLEDPSLSPLEALRMSKAQTYGYKAELFILDLSFLGWFLLAALTFDLLSIFVMPYHTQTLLGYFRDVKRIKGIGCLTEEERQQFHNGPDPFGPSL